jgi:hypothetical protein
MTIQYIIHFDIPHLLLVLDTNNVEHYFLIEPPFPFIIDDIIVIGNSPIV